MDPQSSSHPASPGGFEWPGPPELEERLHEEIGRAERHGTALSALLVVVENLDEMAREHGSELREQTLAYIAAALRTELRNFDRVGMPSEEELLIVLPGADGPRAEIVARRVLDRLQAIKVEARGQRRALRISVGLAAWREGLQAEGLIERARAATARSGTTEEPAEIDAGPAPRLPGGRSPWEPPAGRS
ncbi:MAG TPA: diguanylate cyclase [Solirubrobacteraceae bacterium]|jgi:diguanylate cyclase (GGDEF)-like protein